MRLSPVSALAAASLVGACAAAPAETGAPQPAAALPVDAVAPILNSRGGEIGVARFAAATSGVLVTIQAGGLSARGHGVHLHLVGSCAAPDFKSAGAHVHVGPKRPHGLLNPDGPEPGDLPNLYPGPDGSVTAQFFTQDLRLSDLLDADGSAIVIHAGPDDHFSQPIGGSGDRIACGVLRRTGD